MTQPESTSAETLRCSFCARLASEVAKLIATDNNVAICDKCVEVCRKILNEEGPAISWEESTSTPFVRDP